MTCPKCKIGVTHRSHRRGWYERLAGIFGYYPFRCSGCGARFLESQPAQPKTPDKPTATEREIRATRAGYHKMQTRGEFLAYGIAFALFLCVIFYFTRDHGPAGGE